MPNSRIGFPTYVPNPPKKAYLKTIVWCFLIPVSTKRNKKPPGDFTAGSCCSCCRRQLSPHFALPEDVAGGAPGSTAQRLPRHRWGVSKGQNLRVLSVFSMFLILARIGFIDLDRVETKPLPILGGNLIAYSHFSLFQRRKLTWVARK